MHIMNSYVLQKHRYNCANFVKPLFHLRSSPLKAAAESSKLWEAANGRILARCTKSCPYPMLRSKTALIVPAHNFLESFQLRS